MDSNTALVNNITTCIYFSLFFVEDEVFIVAEEWYIICKLHSEVENTIIHYYANT